MGIFGGLKKPSTFGQVPGMGMMQPEMPQPMQPGMMQAPMEAKKPGPNWAGIAADFLAGMAGQPGQFAEQQQHERAMQQRQQMADQERMQRREDMQWEWQNKPQQTQQPTEFDRILQSSGLPAEEQMRLRQDYARNRANPVQGVKTYDADGNETLQFMRPNQQVQQAPPRPVGRLRPIGGGGSNVTSGFRP